MWMWLCLCSAPFPNTYNTGLSLSLSARSTHAVFCRSVSRATQMRNNVNALAIWNMDSHNYMLSLHRGHKWVGREANDLNINCRSGFYWWKTWESIFLAPQYFMDVSAIGFFSVNRMSNFIGQDLRTQKYYFIANLLIFSSYLNY